MERTIPASENHDPKLDDTQLTKLANELASGTFPPHIVLKTFNLTLSQFEKYVVANPYFKRTYDTAVLDWNSANSAVKRIKIKSAMSLERGLRTLHDRMNERRRNTAGGRSKPQNCSRSSPAPVKRRSHKAAAANASRSPSTSVRRRSSKRSTPT